MTPLERAIHDTIARMGREGMTRLRCIYLRPQDIEALGGAAEFAGLPVKHCSDRGKPAIYSAHGVARNIDLTAVPDRYTRTERLVLVSLLQGWPYAPTRSMRQQLQRRGLIGVKTAPRSHNGRACHVEEPRLTGRGEQQARALWDGLTRDERSDLREAALRSGL